MSTNDKVIDTEQEEAQEVQGGSQNDLRFRHGKDHPNYKHGKSLTAEYRKEQIKAWQHRNPDKVKKYQQKTKERQSKRVAELQARIKELETQVEAFKEALRAVRGT